MGGWVSHLVAIEAWLKIAGTLPCNVKLLIEGEEEVGSPNLRPFLEKHKADLPCDVIVISRLGVASGTFC